jgi:perosamine synthetase
MTATAAQLAINGGTPVRTTMLPYGRQWISDEDIAAVVDVLRSDWLTTGPKVAEFERGFAACVGAREAVAVSSGTAALHAAVYAAGIGPDDEVIVPAMTFAATANAVVFQGGRPVFADVEPDTLLLDPRQVAAKITSRTKAIIAVDYAGQPCDYDTLRAIAVRHHLRLIADACHALGAEDKGRTAGTLADLTAFSFHPVKHIATGEGGMIATGDPALAERMRRFRNHGIATDHRQRAEQGTWYYEMQDLGYNYRLSDLHCALGLSQLRKLPVWLERRREVARRYDGALGSGSIVRPLGVRRDVAHAYHLYVVCVDAARSTAGRQTIYAALRAEGIGVNVHYLPVHLHPFYRERFHTRPGDCPAAEAAYEAMLSLPMCAHLSNADVDDVVAAISKVAAAYGSP